MQPSSYIILPPLNKLPLTLTPFYPLAAQLLIQFTPLNKLPPHSHTIPALAAQLLPHFTPSGQITPSLSHHSPPCSPTLTSFHSLWANYPLTLTPFPPPLAAQLLPHFTPSEQINPSLLHHFTSLGRSTLNSVYPLWTNYPLTLTPFLPPPWQPSSYLTLPPLNKLTPHSYTILPHFAAQLLHHFTPSEQITPSLSHHSPLAAQLLPHFTPSGQITPSLSHHSPPCSPTLTSFNSLWANYPLTLTSFLPPPLAAQLLPHFTPSEQITPSLLHHFTSLGHSTLNSVYPLWTNYPLTLTPFPPLKPNSYLISLHLGKLSPHSYTILPPLMAQLFPHFSPSEPITPSLSHPSSPPILGSQALTSLYPLWIN